MVISVQDAHARIARLPVVDHARALGNLAAIEVRAPALLPDLLTLLSESPDPDAALNGFERLTGILPDELIRLLAAHPVLTHYAVLIFSYSHYLGETLVRSPEIFYWFQREHPVERSYSLEDFHSSLARFRARSFETDPSPLLAAFRRREYIRIMLRDVLGIATLGDTTAEISALSDILIEEALTEARRVMSYRFGQPRHQDGEGRLLETPFAVLSLGKLGGKELNYSSDIDLLFLYGDGEAPQGSISNREYFIRLAQTLTEMLSRNTREGPIFRIDLRLRPQGSEGEPAISLAAALRYYGGPAHDWEKQALIKVRHSAGDQELARAFIRSEQGQIYSESLNLEAIRTAQESLGRIGVRRRRARVRRRATATLDVKLDRGGIRDIEFLAQCQQRAYGGSEPWLRSGGTLFSLQKLHDKHHLSGKDYNQLTSAYVFLRTVEHRLQLRYGQQRHNLPRCRGELQILERSVSPHATPHEVAGPLEKKLQRTMSAVAEIYDRVIRQEVRPAEDAFSLTSLAGELGAEQSYDQVLRRLAIDSPQLLRLVRSTATGEFARRNLMRFLTASFTSSERYAVILQSAPVVEDILPLFHSSSFVTDLLVRHPEDLLYLLGIPQEVPASENRSLFEDPGASKPAPGYLEQLLDQEADDVALRRAYRITALTVAARDILLARPASASLKEFTLAADAAITTVVERSGYSEKLAVLALGRLGTEEMDIFSDADLLFITSPECFEECLPIVQSIVTQLSAYTREGTLFPIDLRLRPRGAEGEVGSTPQQLASYFAREAQAWEALTYTKLRCVCGSQKLAMEAQSQAADVLFRRFAAEADFTTEVRSMRSRLEKLDGKSSRFNLKNSPGAFYDIDFVLAYLAIKRRVELRGTTSERLCRLRSMGALRHEDCEALQQACVLYRTVDHLTRLVTGRSRTTLPDNENARRAIAELTGRALGREVSFNLNEELHAMARRVRAVFESAMH